MAATIIIQNHSQVQRAIAHLSWKFKKLPSQNVKSAHQTCQKNMQLAMHLKNEVKNALTPQKFQFYKATPKTGHCTLPLPKNSPATGNIRRRSDYIIGFVTPVIGPNKFKKLTRLIAPVHNIRGKVWMKNNIHGFTDNKLIVCEAMCTVFHINFAA